MIFNGLREKFHHVLWKTDLQSLPGYQVSFIKYMRIFQAVSKDLADGLPTLRAMSLVYTTLLSLVPLLAVSFSVLKGLGVHNQLEPMLLRLLQPLGSEGTRIASYIIGFVDNIKVSILGIMGIALLFYTVISLIQKIEKAFNHTWRITQYRALAQRVSDYISIVMVGPVLILTALAITAAISSSTITTHIASIEPFGALIHMSGKLVPYLLVISAFTFIYILVPNTKVAFRSALTGAIFAGILWEACGWVFASFVATSTNYTAVYSGFAILVIFMIWLYLSWLILLIGASISFYHQNPERISSRKQVMGLSARLREKIALIVMHKIGKSFHGSGKRWNVNELSSSLDISLEALMIVISALQKNDILTLSCDTEIATYLPSRSIEHITIMDILSAVRQAEENTYLNPDNITSETEVDHLVQHIESTMNSTLSNISLQQLVTGNIRF